MINLIKSRTLHYELPLIAVVMAALFWVMNPGLFTGWDNNIIGGSRGDAGIYVYLESINASKFFSWPTMGFDLPIFYPWKGAMGLTDNFILPGLLAKFLVPIFSNESFVYNLIYVSALILNGIVTYFLVKKMTSSTHAAIVAGFVFMSFPYFKFHRGHPQLAFAFWIPLTLWATLQFLEKRNFKYSLLIGASITGAFFTAVYYAMYAYLLSAITIFGGICLRIKTWKIRDILSLIIPNIPWLIILIPAAINYINIRDSIGANPIDILRKQSPSILAWLTPPSSNALWGDLLHHLSHLEGMLFFGFIPLLLFMGYFFNFILGEIKNSKEASNKKVRWIAIFLITTLLLGFIRYVYFAAAPNSRTLHHTEWVLAETLWSSIFLLVIGLLIIGWRKTTTIFENREVFFLLYFILVFFAFGTLGFKEPLSEPHPAPMLYHLLMKLPGYEGLRGLSRMGIIPVLVMIIFAAFGLKEILKNNSILNRYKTLFCVGMIIATGAELYSGRNKLAPAMPTPQVYEYAGKIPGSQAMLALPIRSSTVDGRNFMFWNSLHQYWMRNSAHKLVNGFSGHVPYYHGLVSHELDNFPSRKSLSLIGCLVGVNHIILNRQFRGMKNHKHLRAQISAIPEELEIIKCDSQRNCLIKVHPVIDTSILTPTELLVPSSKTYQYLDIDISRRPEDSSKKTVAISFIIKENLAKVVSHVKVSLKAGQNSITERIPLPPTSFRVNPILVKVEVSGAAGVLLKNLELKSNETHIPT